MILSILFQPYIKMVIRIFIPHSKRHKIKNFGLPESKSNKIQGGIIQHKLVSPVYWKLNLPSYIKQHALEHQKISGSKSAVPRVERGDAMLSFQSIWRSDKQIELGPSSNPEWSTKTSEGVFSFPWTREHVRGELNLLKFTVRVALLGLLPNFEHALANLIATFVSSFMLKFIWKGERTRFVLNRITRTNADNVWK